MARKHLDHDENGKIRGVVYRYVNQADGREKGWSYVGNTMNEKMRRYSWNNHGNKNYGGEKINVARGQFGLESFAYEMLEVITDVDEKTLQKQLDEREEHYMKQFDSIQHGYNTSMGGTGNNGVNFSETHRANIGKASKGRKHTDKTKQRIGAKLKGHNVSNEAKQKISQGNKGKIRTAEQRHAQSKRLKGVIPGAAVAGAKQWVKVNDGGYWKNHELPEKAKQHMKEAQQQRGTKVRAIHKDGTTKDFNTMLDCANELGIGVGSVHYYLNAGYGHYPKNGYKLERI